jgi:hypothetical protein
VLPPAIPEGDLRQRIETGGTLLACLVVVDRGALRGALDFIPFFRTSWDDRALAVALYRGRGLRGWADFRKLLEWVRERGFAGPIIVAERTDPVLAEWGVDLSAS